MPFPFSRFVLLSQSRSEIFARIHKSMSRFMFQKQQFVNVAEVPCREAAQSNSASDTASNYSGGGWGLTPPNLGSGFGAWTVMPVNGNNPPYVGTYLGTGSSVASGGYVWGTYA